MPCPCLFSWWAILVATVAYFFLGFLWYSVLFRNSWVKYSGVKMDKKPSGGQMALMFGSTFVMGFVISLIMEYIFLTMVTDSWMEGACVGFLCAVGFVATTLGMTFMYEGKPLKLFLIDAFYHIVGFTIVGGILGAWQ